MPFAIKRLTNLDEEDIQRFKREVKIQEGLEHENIVPVIDPDLDGKTPQFVMPRAQFNLKSFLAKYGASVDNLWIFYQIAEGLKFAHSRGIIHRDLKPENILCLYNPFTNQYRFAICDFGLGRDLRSNSPVLTSSGAFLGTYEYMAPEQYQNPKIATELSDIYSLGKILYEIITGELPYPEIDLDKIPPQFRYITQKACNKQPDNRYRTVDDLLTDLNRVTNESKIFSTPDVLVEQEISDIVKKGDYSKEKIERIIALFIEHQADLKLLLQKFPKLPDPILRLMIKNHKGAFLNILKEYDKLVSGGLDFEYCDIVADFYKKLYTITDSFEIRQVVLTRLPTLGYINNRYHVGSVFASLVSQTTDPSLILTIKDVLEFNPRAAIWNHDYLEHYSLPEVIQKIFENG